MRNESDYLKMQRSFYEKEAKHWSPRRRNPVVGSYDAHNAWEDYDKYLFKGFATKGLVALDYGTGPGRNIIRFWPRFKRIDGVDIAQTNIDKARINLRAHGIRGSKLFVCDGRSIPVEDESYDVVFSVICLQHICCHSIRRSIFEDVFRVLVAGGRLCFQMGYGGRPESWWKTADYFAEATDASGTNGAHDVTVSDPAQLRGDLEDIGFRDFQYDLRPTGPGCSHRQWIYTQVTK